jgi:hypothetical protein
MTNHQPWHGGVRIPSIPLIGIPPSQENHRGQQSREQHNELREFKAKRKSNDSPAARMEHKRIWGYYTDKSGKSYTKAQVQRFLEQMKKGEIPSDSIKDKLTYHPPESEKDVIDSLGEIHVARGKSYPAIKVDEGEVLVDPKISYVHAILK